MSICAEMNITEARQTVSSDATMRTLSELPGPKGLPLLGNLLQLDLKQLHRVLERWAMNSVRFIDSSWAEGRRALP